MHGGTRKENCEPAKLTAGPRIVTITRPRSVLRTRSFSFRSTLPEGARHIRLAIGLCRSSLLWLTDFPTPSQHSRRSPGTVPVQCDASFLRYALVCVDGSEFSRVGCQQLAPSTEMYELTGLFCRCVRSRRDELPAGVIGLSRTTVGREQFTGQDAACLCVRWRAPSGRKRISDLLDERAGTRIPRMSQRSASCRGGNLVSSSTTGIWLPVGQAEFVAREISCWGTRLLSAL